jgi:NAD(P)-dependent dehydrogenase (short-subunit alcohol dehydrogenase family)
MWMPQDQAKPLDGRVAIVTGAGRGLGREYALFLASLGAAVVVNDLARGDEVVAEIVAAGGRATAHQGDISRWDVARAMVDTALHTFGALDVLVNNAGLLRVSPVRGLTEEDWDRMLAANLMATVAPIRAAMTYWGSEADAGRPRKASLINTTSETALMGYPGRAAYGAGKAGVANLTVSLAIELAEIGVRVNAVAPRARTEMTQQTEQVRQMMARPADAGALDVWDARHVAPLVGYLALPDCPVTGEIFQAAGGEITRYYGWRRGPSITTTEPWTLEDMLRRIPTIVGDPEEGGDGALRASMAAALR